MLLLKGPFQVWSILRRVTVNSHLKSTQIFWDSVIATDFAFIQCSVMVSHFQSSCKFNNCWMRAWCLNRAASVPSLLCMSCSMLRTLSHLLTFFLLVWFPLTGHCMVVREGLTNPWIPDNWSWGGVASDRCPVVAEFYADVSPKELGRPGVAVVDRGDIMPKHERWHQSQLKGDWIFWLCPVWILLSLFVSCGAKSLLMNVRKCQGCLLGFSLSMYNSHW